MWRVHMCDTTHSLVWQCCSVLQCVAVCCSVWHDLFLSCAMATWTLKIIGLFCQRALKKRRYSTKETCNLKEPLPFVCNGASICMTRLDLGDLRWRRCRELLWMDIPHTRWICWMSTKLQVARDVCFCDLCLFVNIYCVWKKTRP